MRVQEVEAQKAKKGKQAAAEEARIKVRVVRLFRGARLSCDW